MINRSVETYPVFKIFITSLSSQVFLTASITDPHADLVRAAKEIYGRVSEILASFSSQIIHERCFGNIELQSQILQVRSCAFLRHKLEANTPITFVEGESCLNTKFAGLQIRALKPIADTSIRTILDHGVPKGRTWNLDGSTLFMLQNLGGGDSAGVSQTNRKIQSEAMFRQAERLLSAEGAAYRDVVRTWIYISDILDWYGDFNEVRNGCYSEYGFIGNDDSAEQPEQIYLPASTGIEGKNPSGLPAVMDVLAVRRSPGSVVQIRPLYGSKQRSPFRYGSAFSRAVVIEEPGSKLILMSGTASIDEQGRSVFIGDPEAQIRQSLNVVAYLIAPEGATLHDLCEATVFLKHRQDFPIYQKIVEELGIADSPSVNAVADVCREELLFELDAAFILEKN